MYYANSTKVFNKSSGNCIQSGYLEGTPMYDRRITLHRGAQSSSMFKNEDLKVLNI